MAGRKPGASRPELSTYAWKRRRAAVRARDKNRCVRCNNSTRKLSVHHVVPAWAGGTDQMQNLVLLCSRCHPLIEPRRPRTQPALAGPWSRAW